MITRRSFLGWSASALAMAACNKPKQKTTANRPFEGQTLRVFIYSGAWEKTFRETFVPRFQERTGATVIPDPGWWDSIPKLKASAPGKPAFDLVLTDATQGYPAIREGLFQKIDLTKIPNRAHVSPAALDNWVVKDGYGITFPESVMTLGYNRTLVTKPPTSWGDLLDDSYRGKLGLYNSFYMSLYTFAAMKVAKEGAAGTAAQAIEKDLDGIFAFARQHRDRVAYWWPTSTDMALNLGQKNCALGNMHSPDMLTALRAKPELGAVVPDADRAFVLLMWVIPTGTQVKPLAEAAIDFLLSDEIQLAFAKNGSAPRRDIAASARSRRAEGDRDRRPMGLRRRQRTRGGGRLRL